MVKNNSSGLSDWFRQSPNQFINLLTNQPINLLTIILLFIASCRPPAYTPKPPGYFKIDTPSTHQYQLFDRQGFPYTFEYPVYSNIKNDTIFQSEKENNPYWINIEFANLGAVINITYKAITPDHPYMKLVDEADNLSFFHHEKADYIDQRVFDTGKVSGILYVVGGNAATRYQFTATDSTKHFMRGALYFNVTPNADSLKPATDFLLKDIEHLITTLKWR